ncbi:Fungal specific transcription factor [Penicillium ucsense]|uniref:Fungal specific transcription factor n=1 Tax=Penicillium ucsense TaxID=2839758 RepID=A0A8J8WJQ9_9EURO|nr:Fungal specific transcription factor [Penicillium ucsense]KAF7739025.1 Fungal specific transcription factor [Penicillium ucsense]
MHRAMRQTLGITPHDDMTPSDNHLFYPMANPICTSCHRRPVSSGHSASVCPQCTGRQLPMNGALPAASMPGESTTRRQYVASLKERLSRVESLLKTAGILHDADFSSDDDSSSDEQEFSDGEEEDGDETFRPSQSTTSESHSSLASFRSSPDAESFPPSGGVEVTPIFKSHERDDPRYFGRSCSLSLLSRGGIEWIKRRTGDVSFLKVLSTDSTHDNPWTQWRPDVFHDLFASKVYKPLPPRSEVFSLIKEFFNTGNRLCPIYDENSFMEMVEWQYTQQTCDDAARWASINMVVSLAYEFRFSKSAKPEKDREKARLYFKNAMSVFTELALRRTDLLSVQALLSMAFFLRGDTGPQSVLPFVTAAMRSCQRMGIHRDVARPDLSPAEREQRRRVFWVAFTIDQSTCLRAGNPPTQHPDDFDVPLPSELGEDLSGISSTDIPYFRQLCRMSVIKSRIFCQLYSAKALLRCPSEIYKSVKELDLQLKAWRKDYPSHEDTRHATSQSNPLLMFGTIALDFVYYNALIMTHRIPILLNYLITDRGHLHEIETLDKAQTAKSLVICAGAARDTLKMVNNMSWGDVAWIWSFLDYVFLAAATIFSTIIRDTRRPNAKEDLQSLRMTATFFATLTQPGDGPSHYAEFMSRMSANLERIARGAVDKDEKRGRGPEDQDEETAIPGSKRHNHSSSKSSTGRNRHRLSRPRPAGNPVHASSGTASTPAVERASKLSVKPSASVAPPPMYPQSTAFSIPDALDGLPPVDCDGYVVPLSPSLSSHTPIATTQYHQLSGHAMDYTANVSRLIPTETTMDGVTPTTQSVWPIGQDPLSYNTTNSPTFDNSQSPFSSNSGTPGTATFPASWEVPLTADWQFGDQFWSGLFPNESLAASSQTNHVDIPILSAESFLDMPREAVAGSTDPTMGYPDPQMAYGNVYMPSRSAHDQGP